MERLSRAIDGARREIPSRQAPPPVTATFMVGAIETLVRAKLMSDDAGDGPGDAAGAAAFRGHAVLRRGRRLGRDDRGAVGHLEFTPGSRNPDALIRGAGGRGGCPSRLLSFSPLSPRLSLTSAWRKRERRCAGGAPTSPTERTPKFRNIFQKARRRELKRPKRSGRFVSSFSGGAGCLLRGLAESWSLSEARSSLRRGVGGSLWRSGVRFSHRWLGESWRAPGENPSEPEGPRDSPPPPRPKAGCCRACASAAPPAWTAASAAP